MPEKPNTDLYSDGETISQVIRDSMVPDLPLYRLIPFTDTPKKDIIVNRRLYNADTDPLKIRSSVGGSALGAWPKVKITVGDAVPLNTSMRKIMADFTIDDLNNPMFEKEVAETYASMAWSIADQVNASLVTAMKADAAAPTTLFAAKSSSVWSGAADVIGDIRLIARDMKTNRGFKLDTVILHTDNYQEMFDFIETNDQDLDYLRTVIAPQRDFYQEITYLKTPGCWVVGVSGDTGLSHGAVLATGTYKGTKCVENLSYFDPSFGRKPLATNDIDGLGSSNIPLNVNPYSMPDNRTHIVEAWIDSVPNVAVPAGIFYVASGI
jgi:hypothetical protein